MNNMKPMSSLRPLQPFQPFRPFRVLLTAMTLLGCLLGCFATMQAQAAQSYDNCVGFIDSLPATITTQGSWCLRQDLTTAITIGQAITIAANNVTIDCNDFKVGCGCGVESYWHLRD